MDGYHVKSEYNMLNVSHKVRKSLVNVPSLHTDITSLKMYRLGIGTYLNQLTQCVFWWCSVVAGRRFLILLGSSGYGDLSLSTLCTSLDLHPHTILCTCVGF